MQTEQKNEERTKMWSATYWDSSWKGGVLELIDGDVDGDGLGGGLASNGKVRGEGEEVHGG